MRHCDLVDDYESIAIELTEEMYIDGKGRNGRKDLTKEELWNLLEGVRRQCFDNYEEGARYLGWIE